MNKSERCKDGKDSLRLNGDNKFCKPIFLREVHRDKIS